MKEQRIAMVSDLQAPYHSAPAVANVLRFLSDWSPTVLVSIGDDVDFPQVSTFGKGMGKPDGEFAASLQEHIDICRSIHALFRRAVGDVPFHISRSNHGDRLQKYLNKYGPALADLRCLQLPELLGYRELGMEYHEWPFEVVPGWIACHGDEGSLSRLAGRTAAGLCAKFGRSVICGHTHRLGVTWSTCSVNFEITRSVAAFEVGHLMNLADATYLRGGSGDWQSGIGLLYVRGDLVHPVPVPIDQDGRFVVEGQIYG